MSTKTRLSSGQGVSGDWRSSPVWRALHDMRIEPEGASLTFTQRLARENGWGRRHAEAVFEEYRRFLFMATSSAEPLTPSGDVDQAWHLHLLYSRHYWDVLCGKILGRPLHHGPTAGGDAEALRYEDQYEKTLRLYASTFGAEAPAAIWPPAGIRFASRGLWIDRQLYWLVPKSLSRRAVLVVGAVSTAACSAAAAGTSDPALTFAVLAFLVIFVLVAIRAAVAAANGHKRKGDGSCGGGGCTGDSPSDSSGDGGGSGCGGGCGGGCGS